MGERSFSIAMNAKMYSMMSDRLYTDRIGSVVREVCSNAWDAMKMRSIATGQPIEPFKVTLPTDLEPHFIVEDFGTGMPDDVAQDRYSTLGLSSKENTNDQIGAFGLGAKSPFAVTDTFTVENTYQGITYFYLCFKNESGLPQILKTGERNDGRVDGVKVIIPAPGHKYFDYKSALMKQLIVMDPKPRVANRESFDFIEPEIAVKNDHGWVLANAGQFGLRGRAIYARMGMVLYPVETTQVLLDNAIHNRLNVAATLILEFPIGSIEPLPSREGLTYDDVTKANIRKAYAEFTKEYKDQLKKLVETQPNPLDAWREMKRLKSAVGVDLSYEKIWVLGTEISDYAVPHVFPRFHHEWEEDKHTWVNGPAPVGHEKHIEGAPEDEQPEVGWYNITKVQKQGMIPQFIGEEFQRYDLRIKAKKSNRKVRGFDDCHFDFLDSISSGRVKFLLMDELEPKYHATRLKSWLSDIGYHDTYFVVRVDSRYSGSKTDFSEFIESFNRAHRGLSNTQGTFTFFSKVPRPEREKVEKSTTTNIAGISLSRRSTSYDSDVKWVDIEKLIATEDEDGEEIVNTELGKLCYIRAYRRDLVEYDKRELKSFLRTVKYPLDVNLLVVGKTGEGYIDRLEKMGIPEFKTWIDTKMAGFTPSDDYLKHNSAKNLEVAHREYFGWTYMEAVDLMIKKLTEEGQYVHPFLPKLVEIKRLFNSVEIPDEDEYEIIKVLRTQNMLKYMGDWINNLEVDMTAEFVSMKDNFHSTYPALNFLINRLSRYEDETKTTLIQYIKDYNQLKGLAVPVDFTQVLESQII